MKNLTITTSKTTIDAANKYGKLAAIHAANVKQDKKKSICDKSNKDAQKALKEYNRAQQKDVFDAILSTTNAPALVTLAEVGYYSAAVGLDKAGKIKFEDAPLSLSDFIEYLKDNDRNVSSPDTYAAAVKDAIDLSLLKLAQGLEHEDVNALADRLEASVKVKEYAGVKCTEATPESIGYGLVESHLQAALDSLIMCPREDGKNVYRVKRSDCRWLEVAFGTNRATGKIVSPENGTRYDKIFRIMRRVIGNEGYDVEVKEKKEGKKAQ